MDDAMRQQAAWIALAAVTQKPPTQEISVLTLLPCASTILSQ
jgi:hypothetical protein